MTSADPSARKAPPQRWLLTSAIGKTMAGVGVLALVCLTGTIGYLIRVVTPTGLQRGVFCKESDEF